MNKWSFSRLSTYARCPLQFRLKYIDGIEGASSAAAIRGTQVHEFAELYAQHCHAQEVQTDWEAGRALMASYPPDVRAICEQFIETTQFDWGLIVADGNSVERAFEVPLPDDLGLFRGRCDFVQWNEYEGSLIVTDYKSGWGPRQKAEECPPQLQCYAWAMAEQFADVNYVIGIYRYLGSNRAYEWQVYDPTPDWATSLVRRIEADTEYRATPGDACEWCDHTHACPLVQADPLTTVTSDEEAAEALRQHLAMYERAKRLKDAVKDYAQERGVVILDGYEVGKTPPACTEELAPGELYYTDRLALKEGVTVRDAIAKLKAAGVSEDDIRDLVQPAAVDGEKAMKLAAEYEVEEDPFGNDETDERAEVMRDLFERERWTGYERFSIRKVKDTEEEAA